MSSYKPTFLGADRWLRNGIPLDAVKLDANLTSLESAINSIGDKTANHTFEAGYGLRYHSLDNASGKWWVPRYDEANDSMAIELRRAAPLNYYGQSDSVFTIVKLPNHAKWYGCRWVTLGVGITVGAGGWAAGVGIDHPLKPTYNPMLAFIIRDAADRPPLTTADDGEHVFATASDLATVFTADYSYESVIRIKNIDQSFAFRYGTSLTFAQSTPSDGDNMLRVRVVEAEW